MFSDRFTGARNPARLPTTIQSRRIRFAPLRLDRFHRNHSMMSDNLIIAVPLRGSVIYSIQVPRMLQINRSPQTFDVVVIGSGAGGGTAVKVLTDLGIRVALLEAGPMLNPAKDFKEHVLPTSVPHRGAG